MLISGDDIPVAYDRFRHRVMFPICDLKGRVIAFGGRALDPDAPAKYLNSPETPLFHKGYNLFNAHRARGAAHDKERLLVVEGYMDAISLAEAGFAETVAPLGTALTEDQVKLLWRMTPEPILCFDGDSAGRKAAHRAVDTALPLLKPGASLMFAFLPDGLDPDDLVRQQGSEAVDAVLARAKPLVEVLFERELAAGDWSTPERRAKFEQQLRGLVARIEDEHVKGHYRRDLAKRLEAAWGPPQTERRPAAPGAWRAAHGRPPQRSRGRPTNGGRPGDGGRPPERATPSSSLKSSVLVLGEGAAPPRREVLLIQAVLNHPWLADEHAEDLAGLQLTSPALSRLRDAILSAQAVDNSLDTATLRSHLSRSGALKALALIEGRISHKCDRFAEPEADRAEVEDGWRHALALHERQVGLRRSLEAAEQAWHEDRSEAAYARICDLNHQLERLAAVDTFDKTAEAGPRS
jgi:DNA primase